MPLKPLQFASSGLSDQKTIRSWCEDSDADPSRHGDARGGRPVSPAGGGCADRWYMAVGVHLGTP